MGIEIFDASAEIEQLQSNRPISQLMLLIWQSRKDLQSAFDLSTKGGQEAFIYWYEVTESRRYGNSDLTPAAIFHSCLKYVELMLVRVSRLLPEVIRKKAKSYWLRSVAMVVYATSGSVRKLNNPTPPLGSKSAQPVLSLAEGEPGANLIGYARAELGMGEHVRMSAAALSETDVPFGVVDFGAGTTSRQKSILGHGCLIYSNKHKVNIFHINADQILPAYSHFGRRFFERRYNIGYPFWELSKFPREWIKPMQLMDEVWAPTTFIQKTLTEVLGSAVLHMPVSVALPTVTRMGRNYFNLPTDQYLFFFAFDCYSSIDRKNPFGVVAAFKAAFPHGNEKAGLIIKSMNAKESSAGWKRLIGEIGGDQRIRLINETMDKAKLLSFMSECDCYVSLHRSEGLGLGPMEAMLMGKPVIVTNYSGNTDYAKPDNSFLVDYSLIPVREGQYLFHEGQVWADPDVKHAAWYMKKLANEPRLGIALGRNAAAFVSTNFSPAHCGQLYKQRLQELDML